MFFSSHLDFDLLCLCSPSLEHTAHPLLTLTSPISLFRYVFPAWLPFILCSDPIPVCPRSPMNDLLGLLRLWHSVPGSHFAETPTPPPSGSDIQRQVALPCNDLFTLLGLTLMQSHLPSHWILSSLYHST
jgi:hypothetical protein